MTVLDAQELRRRYGARTVLDGISLTLSEGERVGLVGANGCGKSTFGRILAGAEEADSGAVVVRRGVRAAYLPQEPDFPGDPTAREAAVAGLTEWAQARKKHAEASDALERGDADFERLLEAQAKAAAIIERHGGWELEHRAEAMLLRVGVRSPEQRVSTMSGGERRRVDLARVLVSRPDVAVLDEPTNHLDVETIEWLEQHLVAEQRGAFLLITHDRVFLDRVVHRTAELARGTLTIYEGGYEKYLEGRAEREAHEARAEKNRQNLVRRELDWLRRGPAARTTKQKARIQRAEAVIGARPDGPAREVSLGMDAARSGKRVLDVDGLTLEVAGQTLVRDLTMAVVAGERFGIIGPNGSGKTTLLRGLLGELAPASGTVTLGKNARVTYFGQSREGLDPEGTVLDNVAGGAMRVTLGDREMDSRAYLERFLFDKEQIRQPVGTLSGGEKARTLLAKLLLTPSNLLVLDEPTNDLDVPTLAALEQMLLELDGTAIVVTHDRWFLDRVATSILAFEGDGRVVRYPGGYTSYRELSRAARARDSSAPTAATQSAPPAAKPDEAQSGASKPTAGKSGASLTYGEQIELDGILDAVAAAEDGVSALEKQLADPDLYADAKKAGEVADRHAAAKEKLDALVARWEFLEEKREAAG